MAGVVKSLKYPLIRLIRKGNQVLARADPGPPSIQYCPCYVITAPLLAGRAGKRHAAQSHRRPLQQGGRGAGAIVRPTPAATGRPCEWPPRTALDALADRYAAPPARPIPADPAGNRHGRFHPVLAADLLDLDYRPLASKQQVNLQQRYHGQVLLVVNTASKCGYTPQYEGLEALQKRYAGRGFAVLGFPSNDFKGQSPVTRSRSRISARSPTGSSSRCSRRCTWSVRRRRRSING